jgi:hypothetical protein
MGVALSILGNNTSSLVGVAISASLLPPAVNAGICWIHGMFQIFSRCQLLQHLVLFSSLFVHSSFLAAFLIRIGAVDSEYTSHYFQNIGTISLCLTIVNILCIWIFGVIMFSIKEVAPYRSKSAFWQNDIKVARAIKKGNRKIDMGVIKAGLQDAIQKEELARQAKVQKEELARQAKGEGGTSNVDNHPASPNRYGHQHHHHNNRRSGSARNVNFNLNAIPSVDKSVMEELFGSVGSADIPALLDDEEFQDQATDSIKNMSRFPFFWQTY